MLANTCSTDFLIQIEMRTEQRTVVSPLTQQRSYFLLCSTKLPRDLRQLFYLGSIDKKVTVKKCTLVGTMRKNKRELPNEILQREDLCATSILKTDDGITLTSYQCKTSKSALILSSLQEGVSIFCNHNKVAIDIEDNISKIFYRSCEQALALACFVQHS